jgi:ribose transport system substrate-binding protein
VNKSSLLTLVAVALAIAGCGSSGSSENVASTSTGGSPTRPTGDSSLKIAFIPKGATHEFWKTMKLGADKAASETGAEILWKSPPKEDDREEQIKVVENFVNEKVSGIVLAPLDEQALRRPVEDAQNAKIPVLIVDSGLKDVKTVSYIATDNFEAGKRGGEKLAKALGGKGKVIMLRYVEGSASTMQREDGFLEAAKKGGLEVISAEQYGGATRDTAQSASENLLQRYLQGGNLTIDGIFTPNESTTFGMLRALQNAKVAGKVKFVGFDSSPELVTAISAGEIHGLVLQNPFKMGYEGVMQMVKHLKGEKISEKIDTGAAMVDRENLESAEVKALLGVK